MSSRIVNVADVSSMKITHGERFECELVPVGRTLESRKLGFNVTTIPPGKRAFPYHAHRANEEMFFVLDGEGSVRIDGETHRIRKGDFISLPPGKASAHQIVNDSKAPLRYLAVSTSELPEVVDYPDSGKVVCTAGAYPWEPPNEDAIRFVGRLSESLDYWDGEK
jgi:uncharacterized cupin superfamily protein